MISIFIVFLMVQPLKAQGLTDERTGTQTWLKLGIGHSGAENFRGVTGIVSAHYFSAYGVIGLRYIVSDRAGVDPGVPQVNRITGMNEVSMNWGYSSNVSILSLSASAGLGSLWWHEQVAGDQERLVVISVPLEAQILIKTGRFLGIGAMLSTSLNKKTTITSGMLVLQIGNFK